MKSIISLFVYLLVIYIGVMISMLAFSRSEYYDGINQHIETALSSDSGSTEPDRQLMSHRMILSDERDGLISPEKARQAFSITAAYFSDVLKNCMKDNDQPTKAFLSCANQRLGEHFYYYPSRETGIAWAGHYSDCDSNVYLLLDALRLAGKTASIVYAPGHAFLSWTDEQSGAPVWWETTSNRNHGRQADLTESLYQKTLAPFYYHPQPAEFAERFYTTVVTLNSLNTELKEKRLKDMIRQYPDNPFVEDLEYENKISLTPADITRLQALLKTDISSGTKKYLLAAYYLKNNNPGLSKYYISMINTDSCGTDCQQIKKRFSHVDSILLTLSNSLSKKTVSNKFGHFSVDKMAFPVHLIQEGTYSVTKYFILILSLLGVRALYSDLKSARTRQP